MYNEQMDNKGPSSMAISLERSSVRRIDVGRGSPLLLRSSIERSVQAKTLTGGV